MRLPTPPEAVQHQWVPQTEKAKKIREQSESYLNPNIEAQRIAARDVPTDSIWGEGISQYYKPDNARGESVLLVDRKTRSSLFEDLHCNSSTDKRAFTFKLSALKERDRLSNDEADAGSVKARSARDIAPEM